MQQLRDFLAPKVDTAGNALRTGSQNLANPTYHVPFKYTTGRGTSRTTKEGNAAIQFTPEMKDLAEVVANHGYDVRFIPLASHIEGAKKYIQRKPNKGQGWNAHEEDILGCSEKEVFITDPKGKVRYINGHTVRDHNAMTRLHNKMNMNNVMPGTKISRALIKRLANTFLIQDGKVVYDHNPAPEELMPYIEAVRGPIKPKAAFKYLILDPVINSWIQDGILDLNNTENLFKARFTQRLLNIAFNDVIGQEVAIKVIGDVDFEQQENIDKYEKIKKKKKAFDAACLEVIAEFALLSRENESDRPKMDAIMDLIDKSVNVVLEELNSEEEVNKRAHAQQIMNPENVQRRKRATQNQSKSYLDQNGVIQFSEEFQERDPRTFTDTKRGSRKKRMLPQQQRVEKLSKEEMDAAIRMFREANK